MVQRWRDTPAARVAAPRVRSPSTRQHEQLTTFSIGFDCESGKGEREREEDGRGG